MARTATIRTRSAGRLVEVAGYDHARRTDDERVRAVKAKKTTEVMAKYNKKTSIQKFELMLAANFIPGDNVGCLTYDDDHLPESRAAAERRFRYFRQKLQAAYRKLGIDLVMFWSTENKHGDGRYHHHFVCNATGDDYARIRAAWIYGTDVDLQPLRVDKKKNYLTLATYYAKEAREKVGLRSWSYTRNAKKPEQDVEQISGPAQMDPPEGVVVLDRHVSETRFGSFFYMKYLLPPDPERERVRAVHRKLPQ